MASTRGCGLTVVGATATDAATDGGAVGADVVTAGSAADDDDASTSIGEPLDATTLREAGGPIPDGIDAGQDGGCGDGRFFCVGTGRCVSACIGCPTGSLSCEAGRACVETCRGCAGSPFECWACGADETTLTRAMCTTGAATCFVPGVTKCGGCQTAGCFGTNQICETQKGPGPAQELGPGPAQDSGPGPAQDSQCHDCGEPGTDKAACAGGGKCDARMMECK